MPSNNGKHRLLPAFTNGASVTAAAFHAEVDRYQVRQWELEDRSFAAAWRQARRQRVRDLAFDLVLNGNVQLIKALLDYSQPSPQEAQPSFGRIEIIMPDENDSTPHEFIEITRYQPQETGSGPGPHHL